jgi:hypothetical protein
VRFRGQVTDIPGGCRLAVRTELLPHGALRGLSPFLRQVMHRSWNRDLRTIKTIIEPRPRRRRQDHARRQNHHPGARARPALPVRR